MNRILASAFVLCLVLPDTPPGAQASDADQGVVTDPLDSGWEATWNLFWYLRGLSGYDDLTFIYGGVDGSSALVIHDYDTGESEWILLEGAGATLYLSDWEGSPPLISTTERGLALKSKSFAVFSSPQPYDRPTLCDHLIALRTYSILIPPPTGEVVIHCPFLTGPGWEHGGATKEDATSIVGQLDLLLKVKGALDEGIVKSQKPEGGTLMSPNDPVEVEFMAAPLEMEARKDVQGDEPAKAIDLTARGNSLAGSARITTCHTDFCRSPIADRVFRRFGSMGGTNCKFRKDIFFALPTPETEQEVKVRQSSGSRSMLLLTALIEKDGELYPISRSDGTVVATLGSRPFLEFIQPAGAKCYIMAEFGFRETGRISIEVAVEAREAKESIAEGKADPTVLIRPDVIQR